MCVYETRKSTTGEIIFAAHILLSSCVALSPGNGRGLHACLVASARSFQAVSQLLLVQEYDIDGSRMTGHESAAAAAGWLRAVGRVALGGRLLQYFKNAAARQLPTVANRCYV